MYNLNKYKINSLSQTSHNFTETRLCHRPKREDLNLLGNNVTWNAWNALP